MKLDQDTKDYLRHALLSHETCRHDDNALCFVLMLSEASIRRGRPIEDDDEVEEAGGFLADCVLESLILKGIVEVDGMTEDGDFILGFTQVDDEESR